MKSLITILLILSFNSGFSQDKSVVYIDVDGKVKFEEWGNNLYGFWNDTVNVNLDSYADLEKIRFTEMFERLTLVEIFNPSWNYPEPPSKINDTSYGTSIHPDSLHLIDLSTFDTNWLLVPDLKPQDTIENKYSDIIYGDGLTDSILKIIKIKLAEYIDVNYGKYISYETSHKLYMELSENYTRISKTEAKYDYLVDYLVLPEINKKKQLVKVNRYHFYLGVSLDKLEYDNKGNLIYYSNEQLGSIRNEFYFIYDSNMRVTNVTHHLSSEGNSSQKLFENPSVSKMKFTYNELGIINSQSILQSDKSWITYYYEIK